MRSLENSNAQNKGGGVMTEEQRKKANELADKIKNTRYYLGDCKNMLEKDYSGIEVRCTLSTVILHFELPKDIRLEILAISKNALECQLRQLEKEFEKL